MLHFINCCFLWLACSISISKQVVSFFFRTYQAVVLVLPNGSDRFPPLFSGSNWLAIISRPFSDLDVSLSILRTNAVFTGKTEDSRVDTQLLIVETGHTWATRNTYHGVGWICGFKYSKLFNISRAASEYTVLLACTPPKKSKVSESSACI